MTLPTAGKIYLRQIEPGDIVTGFSLGHSQYLPLKIFLRKNAKDYHDKNIAKTYVLVDDGTRVHGYVTLMCGSIELDIPPDDCDGVRYKEYPAVKIARFAVDKDHQNNGYGRSLLNWAIATVTDEIMPVVGCRFIVVDSKQSAVEYYEKAGFKMLDTDANRASESPILFFDLHRLYSA